MRRHHVSLISSCALLLGLASQAHAASGTSDVLLPGGTKALAKVLGIEPAPEPSRAVALFARLLHALPEGADAQSDARVARLREHSLVIAKFQAALDAVQPAGKGVSLSMAAAGKAERKRLQDFLDLIGVKLRERKKQFSVEQRRDRDAAVRVQMLADVGIDLGPLARRLNEGETVRIEVPSDRVPVPFTAAFWSQHVFQAPIDARDLVASILGNRRAALLAHGLLALDDRTLDYLASHAESIERLDGGRASAFAAFAHTLVIRDGQVVTPGGTDLLALWEDAVGESVTSPDRFLHELFGRDGGRLAYLYAVTAQLDADRRAFALGAWIKDARLRRERFRALVDATHTSVAEWDIEKRPFAKLPSDVGMVLSSVRVRAGGAPVEPSALKFWSRAFDGSGFPDQPARDLRNLDEDGVVDAAWFVEQVSSANTTARGVRLEQLRFGQRAFDGATEATLGDAFVAIRAVISFPALMHLLERAGVRSPSVFAAAARRASAITDLNPNAAHAALSGFQGGLALVDRLARSAAIDREQTERLVTALAAIDVEHEGQFGQGLGVWLQTSIGAVLQSQGSVKEASLIDAAAGAEPNGTTTLRWEGRNYRVEIAAADAKHYHRIRDGQKGPTLDTALALQRVSESLLEPSLTLTGVRTAVDTLKTLAPRFAPVKLTVQERPLGLDDPPDQQRRILRVSQDLAKISKPQDLKKAPDEAKPLRQVLDQVLPQSLLTLSYVWAMSDAEIQGNDGGLVALRHDFGFGESGDAPRRTMWAEPKPDLVPGHPWRVRGSLLGLEIPFGSQSLRRLSPDESPVPTLNGNDILTITRGISLLSPRRMSDSAQAAVADAVERGRARVNALTSAPSEFEAVVRDAGLDGWRARQVLWSLENSPESVPSAFGMRDLVRLGQLPADIDLSPWGMPANAVGGCLCLDLDVRFTWWNASGRTQLGLLPSVLPDLNLRVAAALHELHVPAVLGRAVLSYVAQSYVDRVRTTDSDEWLGFARTATQWPREEIEDAIAALAADGPLTPETSTATRERR